MEIEFQHSPKLGTPGCRNKMREKVKFWDVQILQKDNTGRAGQCACGMHTRRRSTCNIFCYSFSVFEKN
jgi:hypothetical protein